MHQEEVLGILLKTHLVDDTPGHREGGDTGRPDHRVDEGSAEQLHHEIIKLSKQHTAGGIKDKGHKPKTHNKQGFGGKELACVHIEGDGDTEKDGHEVGKHLLCRLGKRFQHATLTDKVTEHQKSDQRARRGHEEAGDDRDNDREEDLGGLADRLALIGHPDPSLLLGGEKLDDRRLNDRHKRHIGIRRYRNGTDVIRLQGVGHDDRGRAVGRTDNGDGGRVLDIGEEHRRRAEGKEDAELGGGTEDHQLGV